MTDSEQIASILRAYGEAVDSQGYEVPELEEATAALTALVADRVREARLEELDHIACHDDEISWLEDPEKWRKQGNSPSMELSERIEQLQNGGGDE